MNLLQWTTSGKCHAQVPQPCATARSRPIWATLKSQLHRWQQAIKHYYLGANEPYVGSQRQGHDRSACELWDRRDHRHQTFHSAQELRCWLEQHPHL